MSEQVNITVYVPATSNAPRVLTVKSWVPSSQGTLGLLLVQVLGPQVGGFEEPETVSLKARIVEETYV